LLERIRAIIESKINKVLERFEDPREQLDYVYDKMLQKMHDLDMSLARAVAARKKLEFTKRRILDRVERLERQAKEALKLGREDLAKQALVRKHTLLAEVEKLDKQIEEMKEDEEELKAAREKLRAQLAAFEARKERLKAEYETALAQKEIKEAVTGLSKDVASVGSIVRRAEERIEEYKARAEAIDELVAAGGLVDYLEPEERDVIERELEKARIEAAVEEELRKLKEGS